MQLLHSLEIRQLVRLEENRLQCCVWVLWGVLDDVGHQPDGLLGQGHHQYAGAVLVIGDAAEMNLAIRHSEPRGWGVAPERRQLEIGGSIVVRSCSWSADGGRVVVREAHV